MGKSKPKAPKKPEMSIGEKTQHAVAAAEWDHYKAQYQPIERDYLRDAQLDRSDRARSQASSAVMREGTDAMRLAALGGGVSGAGGAVGNAMTEARVGATAAEREERDGRILGALGVGRQLATDTTRSLSALGRSGAQGAIGEMRNKLKVDTARSAARAQMIGSVAGAGAAVYGHKTGGLSGAGASGPKPEVIDKGRTLNRFDDIF